MYSRPALEKKRNIPKVTFQDYFGMEGHVYKCKELEIFKLASDHNNKRNSNRSELQQRDKDQAYSTWRALLNT
jgi:hypothetical protein